MRMLFDALFGLGEAGVDAYQNMRARFFRNMVILFSLALVQWAMNYWDFQLVNVVIYFALLVLTLYAWSHPAVITAMTALQVARKKDESETPPFDANYYRLYIAYALLWLSIVSMFMTTLPLNWYLSFKESLSVTLIGMIFISVIAWAAFFKWTTIVYYKRIITTYALCGFLICAWILIPGSIKHWAGVDFYGPAGTSETAKALAKAKRNVSKTVDEARAKEIVRIGEEIADCKGEEKCLDKINPDDMSLWNQAESEIDEATISNGISQISWPSFSRDSSATATPADYNPAPAPAYTPAAKEESNPEVFIAPAQKEEARPVNISGNKQLSWCGGPFTIFEISQSGNSFTGETRYPSGGRMVIIGSIVGNSVSGKWKLIGHTTRGYEEEEFFFDAANGTGSLHYSSGDCPLIVKL